MGWWDADASSKSEYSFVRAELAVKVIMAPKAYLKAYAFANAESIANNAKLSLIIRHSVHAITLIT